MIQAMRKDGRHFFAKWLNVKDRVFRESMHQTSWLMRWKRAFTTDLVFNHSSWHRAQNPYRNIKICFTTIGWIRSDLVRRMAFPDLAVVACTSTALCVYNSLLAQPGFMIACPEQIFMLTSMAVGLLVTFRTSTSYGRYNDAVSLWAILRSEVRELHARILARVPSPRSAHPLDAHIWRQRIHGAKLAQTFPHAMKYHLTRTGQNACFGYRRDMTLDEVKQKKLRYLSDELALIWDVTDPEERAIFDRLLDPETENCPLHVCQELTHLNATAFAGPNPGGVGHPNSEGIDQIIRSLQRELSQCERILQTPIYTVYTTFTSRVIFLWVNIMPLGIYPLLGPALTPVTTVSIAFLLLGIDHIGLRVEEPMHILPLWQFVDIIDKDCEQMRRAAKKLG